MIPRFSRLCFLLGSILLFAAAVLPLGAQVPGDGWALNWSDEFDGASLDTTKWGITTGARRDAQNVAAAVSVGSGAMTISTYTESGVHKTGFVGSSGKFDNAFGYWEARVRFTSRDGMLNFNIKQLHERGENIRDSRGDVGHAGFDTRGPFDNARDADSPLPHVAFASA